MYLSVNLESTNRDCIDMVERCIFIVCLDTRVKATANKENIEESQWNNKCNHESKSKATPNGGGGGVLDQDLGGGLDVELLIQDAHQMLHGCNSENNSGNRWFDKTMQFIISEDGACGINYEHSPAEGIVVIDLSEHLFRYMLVREASSTRDRRHFDDKENSLLCLNA
jgi:hypothetical protein